MVATVVCHLEDLSAKLSRAFTAQPVLHLARRVTREKHSKLAEPGGDNRARCYIASNPRRETAHSRVIIMPYKDLWARPNGLRGLQ